MLSQDCPNHENCQGEIEIWKNLKKNEVFVQCIVSLFDKDCYLLHLLRLWFRNCISKYHSVYLSTC